VLVAPHAVVSHATAAALWDLPAPAVLATEPCRVHLLVPPGTRAPRRAGICAHELAVDPGDVADRYGIPVTVPSRLLLDVAERWTVAELVALADAALARRLLDPDELDARIRTSSGRRGIAGLRRAAQLVDPASPNPVSSRVRVLLMAAGLPRPRHLDAAHLCWSQFGVVVDVDAWTLVSRPEDVVLRAWAAMRDAGWSAGSQRPAVQAALAAVGAFRTARWGLGHPA
jgi:hypothetical protein